ncbi:hypothetical protein EYM_05210 [Ignicoccus islandicus DSM 13165]|uniref:Uncharacterized protein n=1 Tax=Ignicoccus islandicus DSM 13165 TaxID=940295 RepID=A0A0U3FRS5_9CREN|nr:hypothetical protein [Ignicoccus islandicus]ALU12567.1 hypothetical protein EYM_05210 [Ignicoccus islandicus DSM 13165]
METLVLMGIVSIAIAILAASLRPEVKASAPSVVAELSTNLMYSNDPIATCNEILESLRSTKVVDNNELITFGNSNDKYVIVTIVYSSSAGNVEGVRLNSKLDGSLVRLYQERKLLPQGRSLVCIFTSKPLRDLEVRFVGVTNICLDCST